MLVLDLFNLVIVMASVVPLARRALGLTQSLEQPPDWGDTVSQYWSVLVASYKALVYELLIVLAAISLFVLDLIFICLAGSTTSGLLLGYKIISTHTLKPWCAPAGYLVYRYVQCVLGPWLGPCLLLPGCCCGTNSQGWVDRLFGVMWVSAVEYDQFITENRERIVDYDETDDDDTPAGGRPQSGCCCTCFIFLGSIPVLLAIGSVLIQRVPDYSVELS